MTHGKSVQLEEIGNIKGKGLLKVLSSTQLSQIGMHGGRYWSVWLMHG